MTPLTYIIRLMRQDGVGLDAVAVADEDGDHYRCRLALRYAAGEVVAVATDYFEAFCQVRRELEQVGLRPLCYGASRNAYPSGMCRDMGRGLKAYRQQLGSPATFADLVKVFESGPDVDPASVEEQQTFHEQWLGSLRFRGSRRGGRNP
jgi:hypothetical protein